MDISDPPDGDQRDTLSSSNPSPDAQSSSPTHRVRKVSIQFNQHPNIQNGDTNDNAQNQPPQDPTVREHEDNVVEATDTNISEQSGSTNGLDAVLAVDGVEHIQNNIIPNNPVSNTYEQSDKRDIVDHELLSNCAEQPGNIETYYDETKPKRLKPARVKPVPTAEDTDESTCRRNINQLITPDEPDKTNWSKRRSGDKTCKADIASELDKIFAHDIERQPVLRNLQRLSPESSPNGSPTLTRRYHQHTDLLRQCVDVQTMPNKCSSPVVRRRNRVISPSTAHVARRKFSSEARLGPTPEHLKNVIPPQRKISSDARLGGSYSSTVADPQVQRLEGLSDSTKRRRVSFGVTAYVKGHGTMPLNDEDPVQHVSANDNCVCQNIHGDDEEKGQLGNEVKYSDEHVNTAFDNRGFVPDDDLKAKPGSESDNHPKPTSESSALQVNASMLRSSQQHVSNNGATSLYPLQKISTSSLPSNLLPTNGSRHAQRMSWQSDDSTISIPKSILKVRKEDVESIASEDSFASSVRQFKVRRDSIALFSDQNGVEIQQLEKRRSCPLRDCNRDTFKQLWENRRQLIGKYKLHFCVLTLFIFTLIFVVVGLYFHEVHYEKLAVSQKISFNVNTRKLSLPDTEELDYISGDLGLNIPSGLSPRHCYANFETIHDKTCLIWKRHARLNIVHFKLDTIQCYNVSWHMEPNILPFDCFELGNSYWYGPVNSSESQWPIRNGMFSFTTGSSNHHDSGTFTSAVEYYWLSSRGGGVVVDSNFPLHVSWNKIRRGKLCFTGTKTSEFYIRGTEHLNLRYTVCNGDSMRATHDFIRQQFLPKVATLPDTTLLRYPHWSASWESDNGHLNESTVVDLALAIEHHKLNCSTIELDGKWESSFGDFMFNKHAFRNMTRMLNSLSAANCDIALNVFPYFGFHSNNFAEGVAKHYFITDKSKKVPALVKWQHGVGAMLDVTNPAARNWLMKKMRRLISKYNIRTFRFTYGTSSWLPHTPLFYTERINPNKVKQLFTDLFSTFGKTFVQSTAQSQHIPGVIGISSHVIKKDETYCLRNILPDVLNLGMMGYPFINSDGFTQKATPDEEEQGLLPSRELFLRWMQLSSFTASMRYTVKPWSYDSNVVTAAQNMSELHKMVVSEIVKMKPDILKGMPVIRPMWWIDPHDVATFTIDDQFLIGDSLLVAPILCEGNAGDEFAVRDIYIPRGIWKNPVSESVIVGRKWIRQYKVGHFQIPYFEKLPEYIPVK